MSITIAGYFKQIESDIKSQKDVFFALANHGDEGGRTSHEVQGEMASYFSSQVRLVKRANIQNLNPTDCKAMLAILTCLNDYRKEVLGQPSPLLTGLTKNALDRIIGNLERDVQRCSNPFPSEISAFKERYLTLTALLNDQEINNYNERMTALFTAIKLKKPSLTNRCYDLWHNVPMAVKIGAACVGGLYAAASIPAIILSGEVYARHTDPRLINPPKKIDSALFVSGSNLLPTITGTVRQDQLVSGSGAHIGPGSTLFQAASVMGILFQHPTEGISLEGLNEAQRSGACSCYLSAWGGRPTSMRSLPNGAFFSLSQMKQCNSELNDRVSLGNVDPLRAFDNPEATLNALLQGLKGETAQGAIKGLLVSKGESGLSVAFHKKSDGVETISIFHPALSAFYQVASIEEAVEILSKLLVDMPSTSNQIQTCPLNPHVHECPLSMEPIAAENDITIEATHFDIRDLTGSFLRNYCSMGFPENNFFRNPIMSSSSRLTNDQAKQLWDKITRYFGISYYDLLVIYSSDDEAVRNNNQRYANRTSEEQSTRFFYLMNRDEFNNPIDFHNGAYVLANNVAVRFIDKLQRIRSPHLPYMRTALGIQ